MDNHKWLQKLLVLEPTSKLVVLLCVCGGGGVGGREQGVEGQRMGDDNNLLIVVYLEYLILETVRSCLSLK